MVIASPIKPEVLDWVIEESGYDPAELAKKVGVENDDLMGWTAGDSVAPKGKVNQISGRLNVRNDMPVTTDYQSRCPDWYHAHFRL